MTSQQEYERFVAKFLRTTLELKSDFGHLSVENQQRFVTNLNMLLRYYDGCTVTLKDLLNLIVMG